MFCFGTAVFSADSKAAYVPPARHGEFTFMDKDKFDRMAFNESNSTYSPQHSHYMSVTTTTTNSLSLITLLNTQYTCILPVPHKI